MAVQADDNDMRPGLAQALLGHPGPAPGLAAVLTGDGAPGPQSAAAHPPRVPGYIDSRTGKFVPLFPGVSPAAFAAQQSSPLQNALAGYGAETLHMRRSLGHFLKGAVDALQGNPTPLMIKASPEPDEDMRKDLMANSLAARFGALAADTINTLPAQMVGGELVAPLAKAIQGEGRLAAAARAGIKGAGEGMGKGMMMPADDAEERLKNTGTEGLRRGLRKARKEYLKKG